MWLKTEIKEGIGLTDEEIAELVTMYLSGKYYLKDIEEWFGITRSKLKRYLEIAKERGIYQKCRNGLAWGESMANL
jgi:DNA-binding transcriptional regulator LsrR (DeoR family)